MKNVIKDQENISNYSKTTDYQPVPVKKQLDDVRNLSKPETQTPKVKFQEVRPKRKILVSGNAGDKKNHHPVDCNFFLNKFNLIFQIKFTFKELLKQHFSLLKNKDYFQYFKQKKNVN